MEPVRCSFDGHAEAVARFLLERGCLGRPQDREQYLCIQHAVKAQPLGMMFLVEILDPEWQYDLLNRYLLVTESQARQAFCQNGEEHIRG